MQCLRVESRHGSYLSFLESVTGSNGRDFLVLSKISSLARTARLFPFSNHVVIQGLVTDIPEAVVSILIHILFINDVDRCMTTEMHS